LRQNHIEFELPQGTARPFAEQKFIVRSIETQEYIEFALVRDFGSAKAVWIDLGPEEPSQTNRSVIIDASALEAS